MSEDLWEQMRDALVGQKILSIGKDDRGNFENIILDNGILITPELDGNGNPKFFAQGWREKSQ